MRSAAGSFQYATGMFHLLFSVSFAAFIVAGSAIQRPHFEVYKRRSTSVVLNTTNSSTYLGYGVPLAVGETVRLLCIHPDTPGDAVVAISRWRGQDDPSNSFMIVLNRSFTSQFATLRQAYPQLRRYEALHGGALATNGVNYSSTVFVIRNFQSEDAGDYGCTTIVQSRSSAPTIVTLILTNSVYGLKFPNWPTRRLIVSAKRTNAPLSLNVEFDRHQMLINAELTFQLCATATSGMLPSDCRELQSWIVAPYRVKSEDQVIASPWSDFWAVTRVRETWSCTLNVTGNLLDRSLVVQTTDLAIGRLTYDFINFAQPDDVGGLTSLQCMLLSHQSYVHPGDIVTILCRLQPASRAAELFWLVTTGDQKQDTMICADLEVCQELVGVRTYPTVELAHLDEAQMRLDIVVDVSTTARWTYRAAIKVHGALFYSESYTITVRNNILPAATTKPPQTASNMPIDQTPPFVNTDSLKPVTSATSTTTVPTTSTSTTTTSTTTTTPTTTTTTTTVPTTTTTTTVPTTTTTTTTTTTSTSTTTEVRQYDTKLSTRNTLELLNTSVSKVQLQLASNDSKTITASVREDTTRKARPGLATEIPQANASTRFSLSVTTNLTVNDWKPTEIASEQGNSTTLDALDTLGISNVNNSRDSPPYENEVKARNGTGTSNKPTVGFGSKRNAGNDRFTRNVTFNRSYNNSNRRKPPKKPAAVALTETLDKSAKSALSNFVANSWLVLAGIVILFF